MKNQTPNFLIRMNDMYPPSNESRPSNGCDRGVRQSRSIAIKASSTTTNGIFPDNAGSLRSRERHYDEATWRMYRRIVQRRWKNHTNSAGRSMVVSDTDSPSSTDFSGMLIPERVGRLLDDDNSAEEDIFHLEL
eukprot:scaffold3224_cov158-Amphora_coffeaeformis.AAC.13